MRRLSLRTGWEPTAFAAAWLLIGWVSSWDTYLLSLHRFDIHEVNPVGVWLLTNAGADVFIGLKMAGTVTALGVLVVMRRTARLPLTWVVLGTLVAVQLALLVYLHSP